MGYVVVVYTGTCSWLKLYAESTTCMCIVMTKQLELHINYIFFSAIYWNIAALIYNNSKYIFDKLELFWQKKKIIVMGHAVFITSCFRQYPLSCKEHAWNFLCFNHDSLLILENSIYSFNIRISKSVGLISALNHTYSGKTRFSNMDPEIKFLSSMKSSSVETVSRRWTFV